MTFRPQKRDKQVALNGHYMLLEPFISVSAQTVLETSLWCEWRFLEVEDTPTVNPIPLLFPERAVAPHCCPPLPPHQLLPSPRPVASFVRPIANSTQFYTNFPNFFQSFRKFLSFFEFVYSGSSL